eukprot:XP_011679584.1 PREDICTED: deleted in malignant brain tumors 1 protein [Strongylocentrotus purpuratus]
MAPGGCIRCSFWWRLILVLFWLNSVYSQATDSVRLVNGTSPSEGRVEIWYNGQWNTICDDYWYVEEAQVVCRQLGYDTSNVRPRSLAYYGQGSGSILQVQCSGSEYTLESCDLYSGDFVCGHREDAGVICEATDSVRLVNGTSPSEGRVEIWYNDQWNTICDDYWYLEEAQVVCRQLGYDTSNVRSRNLAYYGQGSGSILQVQCSGSEYTLESCTLYSGDFFCGHREDAGVICEAPVSVRLVNGPSPNEGRVEILYNDQWNTICDDKWNNGEAEVVCRQLGYGTDNVTPRSLAYYGEGSGPIQRVECYGWEDSWESCTVSSGNSSCGHYEDAGVRCEAPISVRLVNGPSPNEGRVEILYNDKWNTICDDKWNYGEAEVVCRQLGYGTDNVTPRSLAYYGEGSGPIQRVECWGWEDSWESCTVSSGNSSCGHYEDAGVRCGTDVSTTLDPFQWPATTTDYYGGIYNVQLVNGPSPSEGRVEIWYNGQWNTICDDNWNLEEAQVVCRHLGYSTDKVVAWSSAFYGQGSGPIQHIQCSGWESNLGSCSLTSGDSICGHNEDAGVTCGYTNTGITNRTTTYRTSPRVIGSMSFVGVSLFLLTFIAIVAVMCVCDQQKASPSAAMGVQLSTLTTNSAPQPASTMPMPAPVSVNVPI